MLPQRAALRADCRVAAITSIASPDRNRLAHVVSAYLIKSYWDLTAADLLTD